MLSINQCNQKVVQYTKTFEDMAEEYYAPDKAQLVYDVVCKYGWLVRLVHNDKTDKIDVTAVANEFVYRNSVFFGEILCTFTSYSAIIIVIAKEEVICYQLELGKSTECSSHLQGESANKCCYPLLRMHIIGGQRSVRIAPPSLPLITLVQQSGTFSPLSRLKHSSMGMIWMCRASFTNSSCPLSWSSTVVSSH